MSTEEAGARRFLYSPGDHPYLQAVSASKVLLVLAIVLACGAEAFGLVTILSIVLPETIGPWAKLGPLAAWVVVAPIGLLALAAGLGLRSGPTGLRRTCVILSIICLALPVVASAAGNLEGSPPSIGP